MRFKGIALIGILCLTAPAVAQEPAPAEPAPAPAAADTVQSIVAEYQKAESEWRQAYYAARRAGKRGPSIPRPRPDAYAGRMLAAVRATAEKPVALQGLTWMIQRVRGAEPRNTVFALVQSDFLADAGLTPVAFALQREGSTAGTALLRTLLAQSPHHAVQGAACFALGLALKSQARTAGYMQQNPKYHEHYRKTFGDAEFAARLKRDPKKLEAEALVLLQRVAKEFADVPYGKAGTLGAKVGNILFELEHLVVGKKAPEISGTDPDGAEFKLSDYAGKVVVIDFWGNW